MKQTSSPLITLIATLVTASCLVAMEGAQTIQPAAADMQAREAEDALERQKATDPLGAVFKEMTHEAQLAFAQDLSRGFSFAISLLEARIAHSAKEEVTPPNGKSQDAIVQQLAPAQDVSRELKTCINQAVQEARAHADTSPTVLLKKLNNRTLIASSVLIFALMVYFMKAQWGHAA